jgi:hypothetical protein
LQGGDDHQTQKLRFDLAVTPLSGARIQPPFCILGHDREHYADKYRVDNNKNRYLQRTEFGRLLVAFRILEVRLVWISHSWNLSTPRLPNSVVWRGYGEAAKSGNYSQDQLAEASAYD